VSIATVTIRPKIQTVTFRSGQQITVEKKNVQVAVRGFKGPSGPAGKNADATFEWATQTFDLADPQQEFVLDFEPRAGSISVYLNGLLERFWSINDLTITLEDLALEGDSVMVRYQKEN
jgi:uncharacterized membrane protein